MTTKINRSELWKEVKKLALTTGNSLGNLRWQSKTQEWLEFIKE